MPLTKYIWDPVDDVVLMEKDENGDTTVVYTHEPGLHGKLISQHRDGKTSYYHYDGLGSTVALSDDSGAVTDTYRYNAFGELIASTGSTVNPFRWVGSLGYYWDEELGQYYVRARHYDPNLARWLSPDPIAYDAGDMNLYAYVSGRPNDFVDPTGLTPTDGGGEPADQEEPKCFCDDEERIEALEKKSIKGGKSGARCYVEITCEENCPHFPLGYTGAPVRRGASNVWDIPVCISTRLDRKSQDAAILHEMVHAKRFCNRSRGIGDIASCIIEETAAYEKSCKTAFPGDASKQRRCVKCGVFFGCSYLNDGTATDVEDRTPKCEYAHIGLSLKPPDPPDPPT